MGESYQAITYHAHCMCIGLESSYIGEPPASPGFFSVTPCHFLLGVSVFKTANPKGFTFSTKVITKGHIPNDNSNEDLLQAEAASAVLLGERRGYLLHVPGLFPKPYSAGDPRKIRPCTQVQLRGQFLHVFATNIKSVSRLLQHLHFSAYRERFKCSSKEDQGLNQTWGASIQVCQPHMFSSLRLGVWNTSPTDGPNVAFLVPLVSFPNVYIWKVHT